MITDDGELMLQVNAFKDSPVESFLETFVHNLRLLDLQTKDYCQVIPELIFKKHKDIRL